MDADRRKNRNIKTTIINGKYISSAEIWRFFGFWTADYETFVWEYDEDTKTRGELLYQTYQNSEYKSLKVHEYLTDNFREEARR